MRNSVQIKIRKGPVGVFNVLDLSTRIHGNGKQDRKPKYSKRERVSWKKDY